MINLSADCRSIDKKLTFRCESFWQLFTEPKGEKICSLLLSGKSKWEEAGGRRQESISDASRKILTFYAQR